jgi:guanyl-specific ribonuclease Sa
MHRVQRVSPLPNRGRHYYFEVTAHALDIEGARVTICGGESRHAGASLEDG